MFLGQTDILTYGNDFSAYCLFIFFLRYGDPFGSEFLEENSTSIKSKLKQSNNLKKSDEKRVKKSETKPYKSSRSKTVAKKDELSCKQDDEEIKYVKSSEFLKIVYYFIRISFLIFQFDYISMGAICLSNRHR